MLKKTCLLIWALIVLLMACSQANAGGKNQNETPAWIRDPGVVYPNSLYLTAIGQADSRRDAEKKAIGNIAQIFKAEVVSEETVTERYEELMANDALSSSGSTSMETNVAVRAEQTLQNVQIGETYTDALGQVYVLAYLDRMQTATIYEEQIEDNNQRIVDFRDHAMLTSAGISLRYALMNAAHTIAQQNQVLINQLGIISPTSKEMLQLPYQADQIAQRRAALAKEIAFSVQIANDADQKVTHLLEEELTDLGFVAVTNEADALLQLRGDVQFEPVELNRNDQKFVRWILNLSVQNEQDESIINVTEKGREGHLNEAEAQARALRTMAKVIQKEVQSKIIQYFDRLAMQTQH